MNIEWINEKYGESDKIFDSYWEVYEWADSLYPDFAGGLRVNVGYATPDVKVFTCLLEHIPEWASNNNVKRQVNTSQQLIDGKIIYKVWVTPLE
jgi:hypothetical protein